MANVTVRTSWKTIKAMEEKLAGLVEELTADAPEGFEYVLGVYLDSTDHSRRLIFADGCGAPLSGPQVSRYPSKMILVAYPVLNAIVEKAEVATAFVAAFRALPWRTVGLYETGESSPEVFELP